MKKSTDHDRQAGALGAIGRQMLRTIALLACVAAASGALAQAPAQPQGAGGDPPGRVARLSDVSGQVWIYNPDANEWASVDRNQPLTTGDRIATDNDGRAEITLGTTTLRLDAATELEVVRLDDSRYVVHLVGGSIAARLRNPQALAEFEVDTDEGRFRVQTVGRYRFDRLDQASDATVFNGQAIFENRNTALPITTGQHAQFWLDAGGVAQYAMVAPVRDAFSAWNDDRDRAEERVATAPATRFVSPEMTGAEDLDRYGQWEQTPDYGPVWQPSAVPAGWAPYSAGHWAFVRPWGWTWVDDARWGFAPFHYGRWVYHRNAWCWAPGTYVARPVYAPALVAWIGGPGVGVALTVGGGAPVGWFPLAPHEVYVPSYRSSPRYVREVNITHVTNVTTITTIVNNRNGEADRRDFANRRFANAVTFVPSDVMTRRQPVGPAAARFRNDPQVRALVSEGRPGPALTAAPVNAPVAARLAEGRQPPRPPFAGRPPGVLAGRPEGARPEAGRADAGRTDRPGRPAGTTTPTTTPATAATPPAVTGAPARVAQPAQPPFVSARPATDGTGSPRAPGAGRDPAVPTTAGPPVAARPGIAETANGRPAFRGGREAVTGEAGTSPRLPPPSPVQRSVPSPEAGVRPGFAAREGRSPAEAINRENRGQPSAAAIPSLPIPNMPIPEAGGGRRSDRVVAPRQADAIPRGAEIARPAPVVRAPETVAPPVVQRAAEPRAAEVQRPPVGEGRMARPETPRDREQRRAVDEKGEKQR
jgi:FecR protein